MADQPDQTQNQEEVLASFPKSDTEEVRIRKTNFKGVDYVDIRLFLLSAEGGQAIPTKKGITLKPDKMKELQKTLSELSF